MSIFPRWPTAWDRRLHGDSDPDFYRVNYDSPKWKDKHGYYWWMKDFKSNSNPRRLWPGSVGTLTAPGGRVYHRRQNFELREQYYLRNQDQEVRQQGRQN